jgi:hypothetical protein
MTVAMRTLVFQTLTDRPEEKDVMRILVATDNHLGFMERDRIRRDDSFIAVEEILALAQEKKVRNNFNLTTFQGRLFIIRWRFIQ